MVGCDIFSRRIFWEKLKTHTTRPKMSIIHVTGGKGGGKPVDRTNFIGHKVPEETKVMIKHLKKIDKPTFRNFLKGRKQAFFEPLLGVIREQGEWPFIHKGAGSKGQISQGSREHENCNQGAGRTISASKKAAVSKPLANLDL